MDFYWKTRLLIRTVCLSIFLESIAAKRSSVTCSGGNMHILIIYGNFIHDAFDVYSGRCRQLNKEHRRMFLKSVFSDFDTNQTHCCWVWIHQNFCWSSEPHEERLSPESGSHMFLIEAIDQKASAVRCCSVSGRVWAGPGRGMRGH